nr:hypothetical protein [Pseudomonadota bacterium]
MGIKIKHTNPSLNEFATDDLIVNINEGALFFKSNTKLFRVQGDNILTTGSLESGIFYEGMDLFPPTVKRIKEQDGGTNPTYWIDNEDIKADVHIGAQVELSSNNPNYPRLAIQPPGHTGGPFTLYARDSATAAYLDWYYPHVDTGNHIMTFKHTGKVGIGKVTDPGYSLTVSGSTSDANGGVLQILTTGKNLRIGRS